MFGLVVGIQLLAGAAIASAGEAVPASYWYLIDDIAITGEDAEIELWIALPPDRPDQKIDIESIEPTPTEILRDGDTGLEVAYWRVQPRPDVPRFFFHFDFTVELHPRSDTIDPDRLKPYDTASPLYRRFTAAEPGIETDGAVLDLARGIADDLSNPYRRARAVHEWVAASITFVPGGTSDRSIASTLRGRRGDCGQISLVFVALCRALGVPARSIECTWFGGGRHRHAEFYLEGHGWLPADPAISAIMIDDSRLEEGQSAAFLADRGIASDDPSWLFGNGFGEHLHISVGNNLSLTHAVGTTETFFSLYPGGIDADPAACRTRGLNEGVVQGGFFTIGERPTDTDAALAIAYQRLAAAYFSAGDYEKVEQGCLAALDSHDSFTGWMNLGRVYLAKDQYYRAEAAFRRALNAPLTDAPRTTLLVAWTHNFLGNCYDLLGHRDMALEEYGKVIEMGIEAEGVIDYARTYLAAPYHREEP